MAREKITDEEWKQLITSQKKIADATNTLTRARQDHAELLSELLAKYNAPQGWMIDDDREVRPPTDIEKTRMQQGLPV